MKLIKRIWRKFLYSMIGFWIAFKEEKSLWAYAFIWSALIGIGVWVGLTYIQWAIVISIMLVTVAVEVFNTAIEATVDAISFQYNVKVKKIKDIAAGATLVMSIASIIVLGLIYIPMIQGAL